MSIRVQEHQHPQDECDGCAKVGDRQAAVNIGGLRFVLYWECARMLTEQLEAWETFGITLGDGGYTART